MKNQNNNLPDERQMQITNRALANVGIFMLVLLTAVFFYKLVVYEAFSWEGAAVLIAVIIIHITQRVMGEVERPKDVLNKPMPLGNSKKDKTKRKISYALESAIYALGFAVADILLVASGKDDLSEPEIAEKLFANVGETGIIIITAVVSFIISFAVFYIIEYILSERKVKRYNALMAKLDAEDEGD